MHSVNHKLAALYLIPGEMNVVGTPTIVAYVRAYAITPSLFVYW